LWNIELDAAEGESEEREARPGTGRCVCSQVPPGGGDRREGGDGTPVLTAATAPYP
jgi:hypothetical protein